MVRFLCYSIHGEPLCRGWFVGPYHLTTEGSLFLSFFVTYVLYLNRSKMETDNRKTDDRKVSDHPFLGGDHFILPYYSTYSRIASVCNTLPATTNIWNTLCI